MRKLLLSGLPLALAMAFSATTALADINIAVVAPITGQYASFGEQLQRGAQMAIKDINDAGGINGEKVVLHVGDDACDPKQAVAVANQMASKKVVFVAGHFCSGSSIPASKIYAEEGIFQITPASTNPKFTDEGTWNVARTCGRDDAQGKVAGQYFMKHFSGKKIAILHDKSAYGKGLADETQKALHAEGMKEVMYEAFTAGEKDYTALVSKLKSAQVDAVYIGGYHTEAALILRQMREQGMTAQLVSADALATEEFWSITGNAGEGTVMTFAPDPMKYETARAVVEKFKAQNYNPEGYTLYTYAAVQMWAQAAQAIKSTEGKKISEWLRGTGNTVKTIIGDLKVDSKGDLIDAKYVWYKWSNGKYVEDPSL